MTSKTTSPRAKITEGTICAIATAANGAIGIIRVSGTDAITITDKIFTPAGISNKALAERKPNTITFGTITDDDGTVIDEVLVSIFRAPRSYTGENAVEISCHGSPYILQQVMQRLITSGCRAAKPGEYTLRAFMNGKMDLSQAESVADLIAATDKATHKMAINQMRGGFTRELAILRDRLLHLTSLLELELDFSDHEELEFADRSELYSTAISIKSRMTHLANSFSMGNALKNGVPVAIIGETNVGKSTLLNALLGEDKAIVSDIHGTTRDTIEDTTIIDGITFRFIDTAGIRHTKDTIEAMGIERSFHAIDQANIVILVMDATRKETSFQQFYNDVTPHLSNKHVVLVMNKCDCATAISFENPPKFIHSSSTDGWHYLAISAKHHLNINALRSLLVRITGIGHDATNYIIVTNIRHYEALTLAIESINRVIDGLGSTISTELIAQDLHDCLYHLGDIIGEVTSMEVIENIFKHFCVGK